MIARELTLALAVLAGFAAPFTCALASEAAMENRTENGIDYIELPMTDPEATKAFYSAAFGWVFTEWGPDYLSFSEAGVEGGFNREAGVAPARPGILVVLYASDLEAARDLVEAAGGEIVKDIFDFPGGRRFHFRDPNGNELAVWTIVDGEAP